MLDPVPFRCVAIAGAHAGQSFGPAPRMAPELLDRCRSGLIFDEQGISIGVQGCGVRLEQLTRGPIRLARELSLTGVVASDIRRPPTFL